MGMVTLTLLDGGAAQVNTEDVASLTPVPTALMPQAIAAGTYVGLAGGSRLAVVGTVMEIAAELAASPVVVETFASATIQMPPAGIGRVFVVNIAAQDFALVAQAGDTVYLGHGATMNPFLFKAGGVVLFELNKIAGIYGVTLSADIDQLNVAAAANGQHLSVWLKSELP